MNSSECCETFLGQYRSLIRIWESRW